MLTRAEIQALLERLGKQPRLLAEAIEGLTPAQLDFKPAPEKWSVREIVAHVYEAELVYSIRSRRTVVEDQPAYPDWDQEAAARQGDYQHTTDPHERLARFTAERQGNVSFWAGLSEAQWLRKGRHAAAGELSVWKLISERLAGHAENHVGQINRNKAAMTPDLR